MEITNEDILAASEATANEETRNKFNLHVFTNDKGNPFPFTQLELFYQCVQASKVGLMHAKNRETGVIETLLVGVEQGPDGIIGYPLAKILDESDLNLYLPPDGMGGYLEDVVEDITVN